MMKRKASTSSEARRRVDRMRALKGNPTALREHVLTVLADEADPGILKLALESISDHLSAEDGPLLRSLYQDFENVKRDPGGAVRVEVLKALWRLGDRTDLELAVRARNTSERTMQSNGEMVRAAGLALLGMLDPGRGAVEAVLVLGRDEQDPATRSSEFTGEPALTAVRLLANLGETNALLLYVLRGEAPAAAVIAEAIRGLVPLGMSVLEPLLSHLAATEDDELLMAALDVLVELPPGDATARLAETLLVSPTRGEVYAFLASAIVASRRPDLITALLQSLPNEMSQKRLRAAREALQLAPPSPEVLAALAGLERRLARQEPPGH